ncbi:breast cancer type 1 susceptibility protein-like [Megalops cyprinoides]|uniref:breast cancer type 1 susceptibility protein-like n=1 Tax=Megalops cyprinoides TaxID=118141 RepID=UPI001863DEFE|nr:breast cancer type 1 susceptibility protein-like [Megalops cyprinoides]
MKVAKAADVKRGISVIWENLQCPICLDLMSMPVSTKCDHQFCRFCMMKLLDRNKKEEANCPVCKAKVTKRSLQESPGFQRLVEGLQNMVRAYEDDTRTDYFTGVSQRLEHPGLQTAGPREVHCNGGKASSCDGQSADSADSSQSQGPVETRKSPSSSVEVKQGFVKLMDLEDSCTIISDKEGFDSGLADMPPTSEKDTEDNCLASTSTLEKQVPNMEPTKPVGAKSVKTRQRRENTTISGDSSHQQGDSLEEGETHNKPKKRSCGEGKRRSSDPDKILEKRRKKSLEKVSEWLLKISPADVDTDDMDPDASFQNDFDDASDGGSSSSTIKENRDEGQPVSLKRDCRSLRLEEQVFGVVYRRDRRSAGTQHNRVFSPESREVADLPACGPPEETQTQKKTPSRRTSRKLTPADFIKRPHTEEGEVVIVNQSEKTDTKAGPIQDQSDEGGAREDVDQVELSSHGSAGRKMEQGELLEEGEDADDSPEFEVPLQRATKRARTNVGTAWQKANSLRLDGKEEVEISEQNKSKSRNGKKKSRSTQKKLAKAAKPLDLVSVDPVVSPEKGPLLVETEVQIESYPSSVGLGSPAERATRRSRRLQVFTEEVQASRKKGRLTRSMDITVDPDGACAVEKAERTPRRANRPLKKKIENQAMRNGCVVNVDVATIEQIDSSLNADCEIPCGQIENAAEEGLSAVPNSESPPEADIQCSFLKGIHPSSQPSQDLAPAVELEAHGFVDSVAREDIQVVMEEEEKNDTEQDTEQLLKSFKTVKRRSFHLGNPGSVLSNTQSPKCDKQDLEGEQEGHLVSKEIDLQNDLEPSCLVESEEMAKGQQDQVTLSSGLQNSSISKKSDLDNFCGSDLVPPTVLPSIAGNKPVKSHCGKAGKEATAEGFEECANPDAWKSKETSPMSKSGIEGYADSPDGATPSGRKRSGGKPSGPHSRLSVNSQAVDSGLLFPALAASEEEESDSARAVMAEKLQSGVIESTYPLEMNPENNGVLTSGAGGFAGPSGDYGMDSIDESCGVHSGHQEEQQPNSEGYKILESSVTPDNLLPPHDDFIGPANSMTGTGQKQRAGSVSAPTQCSSDGSFTVSKRKRPQRLESSESEDGAEEDQLPSLAQLLGPGKSRSPAVQQPTLMSADHLPLQDQDNPADLIKGAPVAHVASCMHDAGGNSSPAAPSPEWVPASQGSVDLFDTPDECDGAACDAGPSFESSEFSNEIIATQQKVAMQEELRRLERMMALVSEALHKKGDSPQAGDTGKLKAPQHPSSAAQTGQDLHQTQVPSAQTREQPTRPKPSPPSALSPVSSPGARALRHGRGSVSPLPAPGATAGPSPAHPACTEDEGTAETGQRCSRRARNLRSSDKTAGQAVNRVGALAAQTRAAAPMSGHEERGLQAPGGALPNVTTVGQGHSGAPQGRMVLVVSGLSVTELSMVKKFSSKTGGSLCAQVTPETTHVIIRTDEELVCERTLKYFLGIAGRKWVVSFQWIVESFKQGRVLNEAEFEVQGDVVNGRRHQGPTRARSTRDQKLLLSGYEICFQGPFTDMTTGQMEWMAELCGAKVVKDPLLFTGTQRSARLVVVQPSSDESRTAHRALQKGATVVSRGWLLDTVATYTVQNPDEYRV